MTIICLIGRHGCGKSTIGKACAETGIKHLSVGQLRRLANKQIFPSDVPVSLMLQFRKLKPGELISEEFARQLSDYLGQFSLVVVDGFPASLSHINTLPDDTLFCYLWTPERLRESRLLARSSGTQRVWAPGAVSLRDELLPQVVRKIRSTSTLHFFRNTEEGQQAIDNIRKSILLLP